MKTFNKFFLILTIFASSSFVQTQVDSLGWVMGTNIVKVTVQPNGNIYIFLEDSVLNLGCQYHHGGVLQLDTNSPNFDQQYSLILAAFMSQKNVDVHVSGCGSTYPYAQNTVVYK